MNVGNAVQSMNPYLGMYKSPSKAKSENTENSIAAERVADNEKISFDEAIQRFKESNEVTSKELKEEKDWRDMSDEEWGKLLDGIDKYIDAFKEELEEMKEAQEEAAEKAALLADADMKSMAASSAALEVANSFDGGASEDGESSESDQPVEEVDREKNWTKILGTDNQIILRTAQAAQKMEKMAAARVREIASGEYSKHFTYQLSSVYIGKGGKKETEE